MLAQDGSKDWFVSRKRRSGRMTEKDQTEAPTKEKSEPNSVRPDVQQPDSASAPIRSWGLNNPFIPLILGSLLTVAGWLISSSLVPYFQYGQKSAEWKRQNQYDNLNSRLRTMRDCLKEFTKMSTLMTETHEKIEPALEGAT